MLNDGNFNLSQNNSHNYFRSCLRGNRMKPFSSNYYTAYDSFKIDLEKKPNKKTKIDNYLEEYNKLEQENKKIKQKYDTNYIKGNLKTNIKLGYQLNPNINDQKFATKKPKSKILKENPEIKRGLKQSAIEKFYNENGTSTIKISSQNRVEARNPIRSLSVEEISSDVLDFKTKNRIRHARISSYLGSDNIKLATFNFDELPEYKSSMKITSNNQETFVNTARVINSEKKFLSNSKHIFTNNRGFYY